MIKVLPVNCGCLSLTRDSPDHTIQIKSLSVDQTKPGSTPPSLFSSRRKQPILLSSLLQIAGSNRLKGSPNGAPLYFFSIDPVLQSFSRFQNRRSLSTPGKPLNLENPPSWSTAAAGHLHRSHSILKKGEWAVGFFRTFKLQDIQSQGHELKEYPAPIGFFRTFKLQKMDEQGCG
ncbi:hypothetical protein LXL04_011004 [Taraxacum kok-saghyz]